MRACIAAAWVLAAAYLAVGLAILWLSPRVPYADAWRFLARFLRLSASSSVFTPDNGHYELLPNLVRVLDCVLLPPTNPCRCWFPWRC